MITAVVFDVGGCLVDESREYGTWADWLGVPRHTFSAVFGAVVARGLDHRAVFQVFRPGFDLDEARQQRAAPGQPEWFGDDGRALHALAEIGPLIESGRFSLPVAQTFPLAGIADAHRTGEAGHQRGKLVLLAG